MEEKSKQIQVRGRVDWFRVGRRILLGAGLAWPGTALAHPGGHGFLIGLGHPLTGLDHLAAMLAVGLLAAAYDGRRAILLPAAFVMAMALGMALGAGSPLPGLETAVAGTAIALGLWSLSGRRPAAVVGMAAVGGFGILHGWAHAIDASARPEDGWFIAGVLLSTAVLHLAGFMVGRAVTRLPRPTAQLASNAAGIGIAAAGLLALAAG